MAKTFVQLVGLMAMLGVIIILTSIVESTDPILGMFLFALPVIGAIMLYQTIKSGHIIQNAEYGIVGLTSIILGITRWFPETQIEGFVVKDIGFMIAVGVELILIFRLVADWKLGGGTRI